MTLVCQVIDGNQMRTMVIQRDRQQRASLNCASTSKLPLVRALHTAIKGRARYRVNGLKGAEFLKRHLESRLSQEPSIYRVSASALTGNVLVCFAATHSYKAVARLIEHIVLDSHQVNKSRTETKSLDSAVSRSEPDTAIVSPEPDTAIVPPAHASSNSSHNRPTAEKPEKQRLPFAKADSQQQATRLWHILESDTILTKLQTSVSTGLSSDAARAGLQQYGPNLLSESAPRSRLSIVLEQFKSLPVALLSVAAGISVVTGGLADAVVIMGVVGINAAIGYATESQSDRIIRSLKQQARPTAAVIRDRNLLEVKAQEIVPGDILVLRPGTYVVADARVIEAKNLSADESALTGESMPVTKTSDPLADPEIPLGDRTNMVYMGTLITGGQGLAVVVATGRFTEMGQIQTLVGEATIPATPMERQLDQVGSQLVLVSSAVCGVVFALGMLRGYGFLQMLKTSVSLAVAAVPEGLPAVATTTLALGIQEMRQHKVLIRRLGAVETLGSVQALCLDKTGTLTINKMSVVELYAGDHRIHIADGQWSNDQEPIDPHTSDTLLKVLQVLVLCNESELNGEKNSQVVLKGSSTENALLELAIDTGIDISTMRQRYPLITIHHRSEDCNVMTTLHSMPEEHSVPEKNPTPEKHPIPELTISPDHPTKSKKTKSSRSKRVACTKKTGRSRKIKGDDRKHDRKHDHDHERSDSIAVKKTVKQKRLVAVKGSPTEVLALCNWCIRKGKIAPLTQADRKVIETKNDQMAGRALRVLGVAYRYANPSKENHTQNNLIWLGLVGMADPIRPGTKELMHVFHQAGIETIMITGDQSPTAYAIGKELNLNNGQQLQILDSTALTNLDPEVIRALCEQVRIFARINPAHKLQIVQALQQTGRVVAMTGDGINDAPALKAADVGVAMGHVGTDVAREVADVVLEDDDLQTMTIAVSQGRTIYNNIRKSVHFLLSTNLSEILVMLTATGIGFGQPLNAMQLLWLNLVTDIFPGLALALDPPDPDVLNQPPRDPNEPIIKPSDFNRILLESTALSTSALGAYGYAIRRYGISPRASTIAFMSLTCAQLFHALSCRSETRRWGSHALPPNRYLAAALAGSLSLQFLTAIVPGLRSLLRITPINLLDTAVISASALLPLLMNEGTKQSEEMQIKH